MKISQKQLRQIISEVLVEGIPLVEDANGPSVLKNAAGSVIAALNEENVPAFWNAVSDVLEGLVMVMDMVPGDPAVASKQADEFNAQAKQLLAIAGRFKVGSSVKKPQSGTFKKPQPQPTKKTA